MSGTDGATATAAGTATDAAASTTTTAAGTTTTDAAATQQQSAGTQPTIEQLQADVDKWKAMSRQNEAKAKANKDTDEAQKKLLADVAAKLGIQTAGGTPDAAQITAQLEAAQRDAKSRSTELAVLRAATRLGADGDALLDSRAFLAALDGLDPAQPEGIDAAIKAALAQSPSKYGRGTQTGAAATDAGTGASTGTASASTAGDFNGAAGGNRQWTDADVQAATPAQVQKAMDQGLLKSLLGG